MVDRPALMTVDEAAAELRMSGKQLRGHIRAGNISFVDVGLGERPSYRFRPADIVEFERSRAKTCHPQSEVSTAGQVKASGRMMSSFEVIDFAAQRVAQLLAKSHFPYWRTS